MTRQENIKVSLFGIYPADWSYSQTIKEFVNFLEKDKNLDMELITDKELADYYVEFVKKFCF